MLGVSHQLFLQLRMRGTLIRSDTALDDRPHGAHSDNDKYISQVEVVRRDGPEMGQPGIQAKHSHMATWFEHLHHLEEMAESSPI